MSDFSIRANGIGKQYKRAEGEQYLALRDVLAAIPSRVAQTVRRQKTSEEEETFWALKDINFEVEPGEVLGIIGRNGAGKSTMLKVLSRVTHPTVGRLELNGRVGSLLEVGTGFHPELSGRENVFLNGAILGMTHNDIKLRFDEIVAFSGVSEFLELPVKRYSTGMYMRLAFAVAAHLEPEILLVDEVLAVGDAEFQRQCLGRMRELATGKGRTVVLVSHNMDAVAQLSKKSIWLDRGQIQEVGPTTEIVDQYLRSRQVGAEVGVWKTFDDRPWPNDSDVQITACRLTSSGNTRVQSGSPLAIEFVVEAKNQTKLGAAVAKVSTVGGTKVFEVGTKPGEGQVALSRGTNHINIELEQNPLAPGSYAIDLAVSRVAGSGKKRGVLDQVEDALDIEVHATDDFAATEGLIHIPSAVDVIPGSIDAPV